MSHKKPTPTPKPPESTGGTKWGTFWKITGFFTFGLAGFLITPYMQVGHDIKAHLIYACMAMTLYLFISLLIYLYAYKEELSGFIFKIFNAAKILTPYIWGKIKPTKESLKKVTLFTGLALALLVECFLIYKVVESFNLHSEKIRNLPTNFNFSLKSDKLSEIQDIRNSTFIYSFGSLLILLLIALPFIKSALKNHILRTFVTTVISGGILAFIIPVFLYNYGYIGETKDLTAALFTVTGGTIALFSLIKSHQKSELEREQLNTQKEKDSRDHIRQLYDSYNNRFDKAVAELHGDDVKAAYTAVPKLTKLADVWLDYKDLSDDKEELEKLEKRANKEVQIIIDVLCKYIRTLPKNCTEDDLKNIKSRPKDFRDSIANEAEVRHLIFSEISSRSSEVRYKDSPSPGSWSNFKFDLSHSHIFYSLADLTFDSLDFSHAIFHKGASFENTNFAQSAVFENSNFYEEANFLNATFVCQPSFDHATLSKAKFSSYFLDGAKFQYTHFKEYVKFNGSRFIGVTSFFGAIFGYLEEGKFDKKFKTDFTESKFFGPTTFEDARFAGTTNFSDCEFHYYKDNNEGINKKDYSYEAAVFENCFYFGPVNFTDTSFALSCDFSHTKFFDFLYLRRTSFDRSPTFREAYFSYRLIYSFPPSDISTNIASLTTSKGNQIMRLIPVGSRLFKPQLWDYVKNTCSAISNPA